MIPTPADLAAFESDQELRDAAESRAERDCAALDEIAALVRQLQVAAFEGAGPVSLSSLCVRIVTETVPLVRATGRDC